MANFDFEKTMRLHSLWRSTSKRMGKQASVVGGACQGSTIDEGTDASDAEFNATDWSGSKFSKSNFEGTKFLKAGLSRVDFRGSNLSRAHFELANLECADLRDCDLTSASFHGAKVRGCRLHGARLVNTGFGGCDLSEADLSEIQLDFMAAMANRLEFMPALLKALEDDQMVKAMDAPWYSPSLRLVLARIMGVDPESPEIWEPCLLPGGSLERWAAGIRPQDTIMGTVRQITINWAATVNDPAFRHSPSMRRLVQNINLSNDTAEKKAKRFEEMKAFVQAGL